MNCSVGTLRAMHKHTDGTQCVYNRNVNFWVDCRAGTHHIMSLVHRAGTFCIFCGYTKQTASKNERTIRIDDDDGLCSRTQSTFQWQS